MHSCCPFISGQQQLDSNERPRESCNRPLWSFRIEVFVNMKTERVEVKELRPKSTPLPGTQESNLSISNPASAQINRVQSTSPLPNWSPNSTCLSFLMPLTLLSFSFHALFSPLLSAHALWTSLESFFGVWILYFFGLWILYFFLKTLFLGHF